MYARFGVVADNTTITQITGITTVTPPTRALKHPCCTLTHRPIQGYPAPRGSLNRRPCSTPHAQAISLAEWTRSCLT